jgi:N-acetylglucosamine kinase-like BadF-type ATPase
MTEEYIIALEGGGTRSQAALMHLTGQVIEIRDSGDVNTNFTSFQQAQQAVLKAVKGVLDSAGADGKQVQHLVSSLVGPKFGQETFSAVCPNTRYHYYGEHDVVFARAGIYRPHGVALVAATGATAVSVRTDNGRKTSIGGWGPLLGDEGSAYHLGLLGLRSAVLAFEGRESSPTLLPQALCEHFGFCIEDFHHELIRLAYSKPLTRAEIAGIAPLVTRLAREGDGVATRITGQVVNDLTELGLHAARRLFQPRECFDVVIAGGMINAGDLLLSPLKTQFAAEFPNALIYIGSEPPAVALGRLLGYTLSHQEEIC